jgi:cobaltochelatase CobS
MSTDTKTALPFHQRMHLDHSNGGSAVKHLFNVLRQLWVQHGHAGFDIYRDPRTSNKEKLCEYLRAHYSSADIDAAHERARQTYGGGNGRGNYRGRGSKSNNSQGDSSGKGSSEQEQGQGNGSETQGQAKQEQGEAEQQQQSESKSQAKAGEGSSYQQLPPNPIAEAIRPYWLADDQAALNQVAANQKAMQQQIVDALAKIAANGGGNAGTGGGFQTTVVRIECPKLGKIEAGIQHKNFPLLLKMCNARLRSGHRLNVWLYGPAGTGKTTAAEKVASVLSLPFHYNGALETRYELIGFVDATGRTIRTAFREAWEHGGVYLFDEIDASSPSALLALNGALANGVAPFPDKMVPRHPDCIILAGANTTGLGGTVEYVGRYKQDAALTDRFVYCDWPLDEALEAALCAEQAWIERVRAVRASVKRQGFKGHGITPRATLYGEALLAAGISQRDVEASVLRKGISDAQWSQIRS